MAKPSDRSPERKLQVVLSVLRLWPCGVAEATLAHRAGLDAATASVALRRLLDVGLVVSSEGTPPVRCHHERIVFWRLAGASATAALMAYVPLPDPAQRRGPQGPVPSEFLAPLLFGIKPRRVAPPPRRHPGGLPPHRIVRL